MYYFIRFFETNLPKIKIKLKMIKNIQTFTAFTLAGMNMSLFSEYFQLRSIFDSLIEDKFNKLNDDNRKTIVNLKFKKNRPPNNIIIQIVEININ
ncbi:hypothetical protein BpHYR1_041156 [Brachionus plicatilis]|uniref:Uncharacterized protein n=1 Tax=Brachionus plicatilis TaxID=10195 RepID=A0A3M7P2L0_BRAPC|nr:hypothetical protein BpHYR1_041156 [Brachionus plicatilis]